MKKYENLKYFYGAVSTGYKWEFYEMIYEGKKKIFDIKTDEEKELEYFKLNKSATYDYDRESDRNIIYTILLHFIERIKEIFKLEAYKELEIEDEKLKEEKNKSEENKKKNSRGRKKMIQ